MGSCVLDGNSYQIWGVGTTSGRWSWFGGPEAGACL
jgi:hypothetical protein